MNTTNLRPNVIITGCSGDIGAAIACRFYNAGYNIAAHYCSSEDKVLELKKKLSGVKNGGIFRTYKADFRDPDAVAAMIEDVQREMGPADVLVNNAGFGKQKLITETSYEDWRETFLINTDASFLCSKAVLPGMINRRSGRIINISSIWGMTGASCEVSYSAAKAAVIGFTKALAKEVGPSGINVNCVAPGVIDTKMNSHLSKEDLSELAAETPLDRLGLPEEIADAVFFLASDNSSFITGQVISPNGGFVI
ncbi:MAG: 3-oxoacyl-ACP reductase FabG [Clostridia bacterium]|nr:3-oxoacyl-ACP reductase FabG [Clostridia bacterium]